MATLTEVIEMFGEFGFTEREVRTALGAGDNAHNAFEGLKLQLEIKWGEINVERGMETIEKLAPIRDRLLKIKMKSRKTKKAAKAEKKQKVHRAMDNLFATTERSNQRKRGLFAESLAAEVERMHKAGELDEAAKQRFRNLGLGHIFEED